MDNSYCLFALQRIRRILWREYAFIGTTVGDTGTHTFHTYALQIMMAALDSSNSEKKCFFVYCIWLNIAEKAECSCH